MQVIVAAVLVAQLTALDVPSEPICGRWEQDHTAGVLVCTKWVDGAPGGADDDLPRRRRVVVERPRFRVDSPMLRPGPDGQDCIDWQTEWRDVPPSQRELDEIDKQYALLRRQHPDCPSAAPAEPSSPNDAARGFYRRIRLPVPEPSVHPDHVIVGWRTYLETNTTLTRSYTTDTPFGPLTLTATSSLWVDWGDGSGLDGPYTTAGGP